MKYLLITLFVIMVLFLAVAGLRITNKSSKNAACQSEIANSYTQNGDLRNIEQVNYSPYSLFGDSSVYLMSLAERKNEQGLQIRNDDKKSNIRFIEIHLKANIVKFYDKNHVLIDETIMPSGSMSRWLSIDPLAEKYPSMSPYNFVGNNPVRNIDPDGREIRVYYDESNCAVYRGGSYYNADGSSYDYKVGTNQFLDIAMQGFQYLENSATAKGIIDNLANSTDFTVRMKQNTGKEDGSAFIYNIWKPTETNIADLVV